MTRAPDDMRRSAGIMDAAYARGRRQKPHLRWRYRMRASEAAAAYAEVGERLQSYRVLELGAAEGLTLLELRSLLGCRGVFHGVEFSDSLLAEAPPLPNDTMLLKGDVMHLPAALDQGSYDLVTALAVLEHLPNPLLCVREAHRMLRPDGVFVATCPNPRWDTIAGALKLVADEHHEQRLAMQHIAQMCHQAGFRRVACRPFMWAPVALLPYANISVPLPLAARMDAIARRLTFMHFAFVNQLVCAQR